MRISYCSVLRTDAIHLTQLYRLFFHPHTRGKKLAIPPNWSHLQFMLNQVANNYQGKRQNILHVKNADKNQALRQYSEN